METEFATVSRASGVYVVHRPTQTVVASALPHRAARELHQHLIDHPDVAAALLALHRDIPSPTEEPALTPEKMWS